MVLYNDPLLPDEPHQSVCKSCGCVRTAWDRWVEECPRCYGQRQAKKGNRMEKWKKR
jgi:hypothetical protein